MDLEIDDFEKIHEINIENRDANTVKGKISECNVEFIYCIDSKFLFIITEKRSLKRKAFKFLYSVFDGNISLFSSSFKKERDMICNADYKNIKFIHDNELVYSNKLNEAYCNATLKDEYYFFEAEMHFLINQVEYRFIYYRDSIKIKRNFEEKLYEIIGIFEKYMNE